MEYTEVCFENFSEKDREAIIGLLSAWENNGILEEAKKLKVYFEEQDWSAADMQAIANQFHCTVKTQSLQPQNWNEAWEANFQPVIIDDFCGIRADFHSPILNVKYELIINPKMSFGTGHHETTTQIIHKMASIDLNGKSILDFGCGTGVLSILAEKMKAASILALDNDEWAIQNAFENVQRNNCHRIEIKNEPITKVSSRFDCIFANINRNVLLDHLDLLSAILTDKGYLMISGFSAGADEEMMMTAAINNGLRFKDKSNLNNWALLLFQK